ncbi:RagB/SusD family nutrient uptake outer membrane protein [Mucilaginibacter phyllosphaerae]
MKKIKNILLFHAAASLLVLAACKKDFLEVRPNKSLLVPETTADLRALLDNNFLFNNMPALTRISDGDLFATEVAYNSFSINDERNAYTWAADIFGASTTNEWNMPYQQVFYANVVLETAEKLPATDATSPEGREIKGAALFNRAFAFYQLSQEFASPYQAATASSTMGIPLKISSKLTDKVGRGTLEETYQRMLTDLKQARLLLPAETTFKTRPNRAATYAMLAKVYLSMQDYPNAGRYADSCLQLHSQLLDYNTLNPALSRPFPRPLPHGTTDEVIFYSLAQYYSFMTTSLAVTVDPALYDAYEDSDLRKSLFFANLPPGKRFRGNYAGIISQFSGIATDEVLLIRSECRARAGNLSSALNDLNTLLVKRYKSGTYVPRTAATANEALRLILQERRKELTGRGTRWSDLRRLNQEPAHAVTLSREVLGTIYHLEPNSKRYTLPIPADELKLNELPRNER